MDRGPYRWCAETDGRLEVREQHDGVTGSTRRGLLRAMMLAAGPGSLAAWSVSSAAGRSDNDGDEGWISGRLESLDSTSVQMRPPGSASSIAVRINPDTVINRDGPADLKAFFPGDLVAVQVAPDSDDEVVALRLHAFYHLREGVRVLDRDGQRLATSAGTVSLTARSEVPDLFAADGVRVASKRLDEITAGDRLAVLGRYEMRSGTFEAHFVRSE
jgi:hypothetical protein